MNKYPIYRINDCAKYPLLVLLLIVCGNAKASMYTTVRTELLQYASEFARQQLGDKSQARAFIDLDSKPESEDSLIYQRLHDFSVTMFYNGEPVKTFEYARNMLAIIDRHGYTDDMPAALTKFKARCYLSAGSAADETGMHSLSVDFYLKGLKITRAHKLERTESDILNNIGISYMHVGNSAKAEEYFNQALALNTRIGDTANKFRSYNNLSDMYERSGQIDEALSHALKAIQCLEERKNGVDYYFMQMVIGHLYTKKKEYSMARTYLQNAYAHQKQSKIKGDLYNTVIELTNLYIAENQPDSIKHYLTEARNIAAESKNPTLMLQLYSLEKEIYSRQGMPEMAVRCADRILALRDSMYLIENQNKMEQAHRIFAIEQKAAESDSAIASWNPVIVFFSMGAVVVILIALLIWIVMIRRKRRRAISEREEANRQLHTLQQQQLQERIAKERELQLTLDEHNRKLTSFTLDRIQTSQQIDEINQRLKRLLISVPQRDKTLKTELQDISVKLSSLNADAQWEEFQYYFEKVHPRFYTRLNARYPELSNKERRLCALLSLGLSSKDIAAITFREVRGVETSRIRLRKKLQLDGDENLSSFLQGIAVTEDEQSLPS